MTPFPITEITSWHAHVYYDAASEHIALALREQVSERFSVQIGRWHAVPVGPHPVAMYQIAFAVELFAALAPFLALNRRGLTILLHPNTDSPHDDHLDHALWMGAVLDLNASMLPASLKAAGREAETVTPNASPA